jgi:alanyl aminopeptidase
VPLSGQLAQRMTRAAAYAWLERNFDAYLEQLGGNARARVFGQVGVFCDAESARAVSAFLSPRAATVAGAARELSLALESIALCQAFRGAQAQAARAYFTAKAAHTQATPAVPARP